jgi:hypothetical protein
LKLAELDPSGDGEEVEREVAKMRKQSGGEGEAWEKI